MSKAKKRTFPWKALLFLTFLALVVFARVLWVGIPNVEKLKNSYPVLSYEDSKKGDRVKVRFQKNRPDFWTSMDDVSKYLVGAVVTSEDWAFFNHKGIDFRQIKEVLEESFREGELTRGASTITQQVAKNVFLSQERSLLRKIREWWVASRLEKLFPKEELLEIYLNTVEWGPGVRGIQEAAWYYFRKSPRYLSPRESAFLAFLIPSPIRYHVSFKEKELTEFASYQVKRILTRMLRAGYLDYEPYQMALRSRLPFIAQKSSSIEEAYRDDLEGIGSFQSFDLRNQE